MNLYLDNSATSWPKPPTVIEAITLYLNNYGASPGRSGHHFSVKAAKEVFESLGEWSLREMNDKLMDSVKKNNFKTGDFFMDLRIGVTGLKFTPPINESIAILGKEESIGRLKKLI